MVRPVFSKETRERDIEDTTTVSRVEENVEREQPSFKTRQDDSHLNMITREEAEKITDLAVTRAIDTALAKRKETEGENEGTGPAISSKTVKELQNIAGIFNALKDFSANPLQKKIEEKVGDMAAGVVERAFVPNQEPQKKDLFDRFLNSQFAYGLGSGMGQRAPELVETFGREKVDGWITGAIKGGGGGGGIGGLSGIPGTLPPGMPPGMGGVGGQSKQQSEMELVLGLQRDNPEHVAAYAKSQGDIPVDVARKMLMVHQDGFINQLKLKGVDTSPYEMRRSQEINHSQDLASMQEYRPGPPRINDDLIVNNPITEDKKWEDEKENVENLETQNIELHPEMERIEPTNKEVEPEIASNSRDEIINYLKSLKDMVEKQGNEMSGLRQELDIIKKDRTIPGDRMISGDRDDNQTTVRSMRSITNSKVSKKGYSYVKEE